MRICCCFLVNFFNGDHNQLPGKKKSDKNIRVKSKKASRVYKNSHRNVNTQEENERNL